MIWEEEFHHCVIEEIPSGWCSGNVKKEIWFEYNKEKEIYEETQKPEKLKNIVNFAIG